MAQATQIALYAASVVGAVALLLMMPRAGYNPRKIGALLGAATLGGLWLVLSRQPQWRGIADPQTLYYYLFSAIAIASAVRVITHTKPVFSALWFVLLVIATSGLFLLLSAEFIAFAMLIIYGGAILVTYVFVIMLATQSEGAGGDGELAVDYDRVAREPVAAIAAGFLLLAVLLGLLSNPVPPSVAAAAPSDEAVIAGTLARRGPKADAKLATRDPIEAKVENTEWVGLYLFEGNPLGLELAGVILLVSLVGAVVITRKRVEEPTGPSAGPIAGPTEARGREPGPHSPEILESIQGSSRGVGPVSGAAPGGGGGSGGGGTP